MIDVKSERTKDKVKIHVPKNVDKWTGLPLIQRGRDTQFPILNWEKETFISLTISSQFSSGLNI